MLIPVVQKINIIILQYLLIHAAVILIMHSDAKCGVVMQNIYSTIA